MENREFAQNAAPAGFYLPVLAVIMFSIFEVEFGNAMAVWAAIAVVEVLVCWKAPHMAMFFGPVYCICLAVDLLYPYGFTVLVLLLALLISLLFAYLAVKILRRKKRR
ncbi:MAG: hypothetical protein IJ810_00655 [Candidatus Methanomethylophilus sp.]|nr:hypothetical protein [Methanomethylophilus sp.]